MPVMPKEDTAPEGITEKIAKNPCKYPSLLIISQRPRELNETLASNTESTASTHELRESSSYYHSTNTPPTIPATPH